MLSLYCTKKDLLAFIVDLGSQLASLLGCNAFQPRNMPKKMPRLNKS